MTKVLLIESSRHNGRTFSASLQRKYDVEIAHSGKQGLAIALDTSPDVIVLDAASLRTSGDRISIRLRETLNKTPIIHIKPEGDSRGKSMADVMLYLPFTIRKLSNRIERFVPSPEEGTVRELGPFNLNLETHTLSTPWNERKLTPKLMALMKLFLENAGQTLARKHIMQQVWETDYVEDTRTLDVHIRWLRQVVEPNPKKPVYLVTLRGVGYQFALTKEPEASPTTKNSTSESKQKKSTAKPKKKPTESSSTDTDLQKE